MAQPSNESSGRAPLPVIELDVGSVNMNQSLLTWEDGPANDLNLGIDNILLAVRSSDGTKPFTICCLKETPDDSEKPYQLVFLKTDTIPGQFPTNYLVDQAPPHLHADGSRDVDIVVSVKSGTGLSLAFWQDVLQPLLRLVETGRSTTDSVATADEAHHNVLITQSSESIPQFFRQVWSQAEEMSKSRTLVLLSGDGGVVDLLNARGEGATSKSRPLIALLPLGTGNAQFHSLHKPAYSDSGASPLVIGMRTLFHGVAADLPVFRASFTAGSHTVTPGSAAGVSPDEAGGPAVSHLDGAIVASYGFHASIVYESDTPAYRVHGTKRFGMVAQDLLRESHPYSAQVEIRRPGSSSFEVIPRSEHAYLLATLVSNLEHTFTISPSSKPLDGQLRLVHFANVGGARIMEAMMKAYDAGKHIDLRWDDGERVYYDDVDEIRVTVNEKDGRWRKVCVDGTIVDLPEGGQMTVRTLESSPVQVLVNASVAQA